MRFDVFEIGVLVLGSLLISVGGTLAGVFTFQGKVLPVLIGYVFFVAGYKVSWYGTHTFESFEDLRGVFQGFKGVLFSHVRGDYHNYFLIVLGLLMCSYGSVQFGEMVLGQLDVLRVVSAGLICFGGYMVAHEGVNEVLV